MMLTTPSIHDALAIAELRDDDIVMIHADTGPAAQLTGVPSAERLDRFIESIISFFKRGTIIVPTFSYSLMKGDTFDKEKTPSDVGLFGEKFRNLDGVERSCHPIFSVAVYGQNKEVFINTNLTDCFGEDTVFDKLFLHNAKILCLGCSLDRVTFVHYVEQRLGVRYRYFKNFGGTVICNGQKKEIVTRYFVRVLEFDTTCNLNLLKEKTAGNGSLKQACLGRFPLISISAKEFFTAASNLIDANSYALIGQRFCT